MKVIKPDKLNPGDLIGVITPSWPITESDEAQIEKGEDILLEQSKSGFLIFMKCGKTPK